MGVEDLNQRHWRRHARLEVGPSAWWQTGAEQAAEIIAWGLQDGNEYKSNWLMRETCEDLSVAFELLTGSAPLHTNTGWCK